MPGRFFHLVTCEHGGNRIPARYRHLFSRHADVLDTHRGFDAGALLLARDFSSALDAYAVTSVTSRLLVDLNRSLSHPGIFSEFTRMLTQQERDSVVGKYYLPYRQEVETVIARAVARHRRILHISSHSFTPELNGDIRNADIGLLYDPSRPIEAELCRRWKTTLREIAPELKVRFNYPYAGKSDGFASWLRKCYVGRDYTGIEFEMNQKHVQPGTAHWRDVRKTVVAALREAVDEMKP